jgi:pSer/pThr/pTyr-binding forkhead associated (FHA) protein
MTALRTGVLVGRYGRCDLSLQSVDMPDVISRVHALFISLEERAYIFDVGSTNGLAFQSFAVRSLALPEHQPSTFDISDEVRLTWWPS